MNYSLLSILSFCHLDYIAATQNDIAIKFQVKTFFVLFLFDIPLGIEDQFIASVARKARL